MNNRVFLLGDSFTDNLYKVELFQMRFGIGNGYGQVRKYVDCVLQDTNSEPLYFDDWLKIWGYDVFNFGLGGCSVYHTFNQFTKIDKNFIKGDRIIVGWTSPVRLDWLNGDGSLQIIQGSVNSYKERPDAQLALEEQGVLRLASIDNKDKFGYLRKQTIPFMSKLTDLHDKYQPIQWSPFDDVSGMLSKDNWYSYEVTNPIFKDYIKEFDSLRICEESDGKCNDRHLSRYGNYYTALIFKTIMEYKSTTPKYINNSNLLDMVFDVVKNNRPTFNKVDWKHKNDIYK
jgi:hypothetical protein